MTDLKPCPFCGGEAEIKGELERDKFVAGDLDTSRYVIRCKLCVWAMSFAPKADHDGCITAWNTRADNELAEALADCVNLIEAWAYGPMFDKVQWPEGVCMAPALLKAKALTKQQEKKS